MKLIANLKTNTLELEGTPLVCNAFMYEPLDIESATRNASNHFGVDLHPFPDTQPTQHTSSTISWEVAAVLGPDTAEDTVIKAVEPWEWDYAYVHYTDCLTDEQAQAYLQDDWDALYEADYLMDWISEAEWLGARELLWDKIDEVGIDVTETELDMDMLELYFQESCTSDLIGQLASQTSNKFMRIPIPNQQDRTLTEALQPFFTQDLTTPTPRAVIEELEAEGDVVWVIFRASIKDVENRNTIRFEGGAYLVALDTLNGMGTDEFMPYTFEIPTEGITLDNIDGRYGWNEIAGLSPAAYAVNISN